MKKWQKSWLLVLASSLVMGWIAQGEATLIKVSNPRIMIQDRMPLPVIIVDSNGKTFEQTAEYDPANGGIEIDTSWAGPNASIYIPVLGINYIWHDGHWVDEEGYYWEGTRRVRISDPQWKERWTSYWREHRHESRSHENRGHDGWQSRGEGWRGGEHGENWQERGEGWRGGRGESSGAMRSSSYESGHPGAMHSGSYESGHPGAMHSGSYESGHPGAMHSGSYESGQPGAMRSTGGTQGGYSSGSMHSSGSQGGQPGGSMGGASSNRR